MLARRSRAAGFGAVCLAAASCGGGHQASLVDQAAYASANRDLYQRLPHYPGAVVVSRMDSAYAQGPDGAGPIVGVVTAYVVRLPAGATVRTVAAFYHRRLLLGGWRLVERLPGLRGHAGPVLNLARRQAKVSVNLEGGPHRQLELDLDHGRGG
jgi:hypothetical protein